MRLRTEAITEIAGRRLKKAQNITVHSVYERTVNLKTDDELISLHRKRGELSPFGIVVSDIADFRRHFTNGESLMSYDGGWRNMTVDWETKACNAVEGMRAGKVKTDHLASFYSCLLRALKIVGDRSSLTGLINGSSDENPLVRSMGEALRTLVDRPSREKWEVLRTLVGRGGGLTPASDDFIVGYAFAHMLRGDPLEMKALDNAATTDISRAYLAAASEGAFSAAFLELFEAIEMKEQELMMRRILYLASTGHSSGTDALIGLTVGLREETHGSYRQRRFQ